ncbi:MAG: hypothetical protein CMG93_09740 [Marinomonas sp.]|nr:hypothetical protein [Marinomonas sp.]
MYVFFESIEWTAHFSKTSNQSLSDGLVKLVVLRFHVFFESIEWTAHFSKTSNQSPSDGLAKLEVLRFHD